MDSQNSWRSIQQTFLDLLFPPTDRSKYVRQLDQQTINELPRAKRIDADYLQAVFDYQDKTTRAIVQAAKYDGDAIAARIMGRQLYDELLSLCENRRIISKQVKLIPIPLSQERHRERGFNQCRRIIRSIIHNAGQSDHFVENNILQKTKPTKPQASLNKNERRNNVKGCFEINEEGKINGANIIIIDDVTTTGATIAEAKKVLERGNPESISALTFAH